MSELDLCKLFSPITNILAQEWSQNGNTEQIILFLPSLGSKFYTKKVKIYPQIKATTK